MNDSMATLLVNGVLFVLMLPMILFFHRLNMAKNNKGEVVKPLPPVVRRTYKMPSFKIFEKASWTQVLCIFLAGELFNTWMTFCWIVILMFFGLFGYGVYSVMKKMFANLPNQNANWVRLHSK